MYLHHPSPNLYHMGVFRVNGVYTHMAISTFVVL